MKRIITLIFASAIALSAQALTPIQQATVDAAVDQLLQSGVVTLPNGVTAAQAHTVAEVAMTAWLDHANYLASVANGLAALQAQEAADFATALQQRTQMALQIGNDQAQLNALEAVQAQIVNALCPGQTGSGTTFQCGTSAVAAVTAAMTQNENAITSLNASVAAIKAQLATLAAAAQSPPSPLPTGTKCAGIVSGQNLALPYQAKPGDQLLIFTAARNSTSPMIAASATGAAGTAVPLKASSVGQSATGTTLFYLASAVSDASYSIAFPASCEACEACAVEYPAGSALATTPADSLGALTGSWALPAPAATGTRLVTVAGVSASGSEGSGWSALSPAALIGSADSLGFGASVSFGAAAAPGAVALSGSIANAHTWSGVAITLSLQ